MPRLWHLLPRPTGHLYCRQEHAETVAPLAPTNWTPVLPEHAETVAPLAPTNWTPVLPEHAETVAPLAPTNWTPVLPACGSSLKLQSACGRQEHAETVAPLAPTNWTPVLPFKTSVPVDRNMPRLWHLLPRPTGHLYCRSLKLQSACGRQEHAETVAPLARPTGHLYCRYEYVYKYILSRVSMRKNMPRLWHLLPRPTDTCTAACGSSLKLQSACGRQEHAETVAPLAPTNWTPVLPEHAETVAPLAPTNWTPVLPEHAETVAPLAPTNWTPVLPEHAETVAPLAPTNWTPVLPTGTCRDCGTSCPDQLDTCTAVPVVDKNMPRLWRLLPRPTGHLYCRFTCRTREGPANFRRAVPSSAAPSRLSI
ncbi:hypothetical protein J6590_012472 [Homalodisca vitripennis]|nr:hypothetical protein J6590_012472 [Homalodisca vitripennis]